MKGRWMNFLFFLTISFPFSAAGVDGNTAMLLSPDDRIRFEIKMNDINGAWGIYSIQYKDRYILRDARLRLDLEEDKNGLSPLTVDSITRSSCNETVEWQFGQSRTVPDRYNEMLIHFHTTAEPGRRAALIVRAYNEGIAFRYEILGWPGVDEIRLVREETEFRWEEDYFAWEEYGTEGEYKKVPLSAIQPKCETPLTVELHPGGPYACIMEAGVIDYPRMWLSPQKENPKTLVSELGGDTRSTLPFQSPWRVIVFAERAGELLERNYFLHLLNPPSIFKDASWIEPGTVIRCVQLDTEGCRKYIDFAAEHRIDYVHLDAGWYGPEREESSDPRKPKDGLDLPYLLQYAKEKGVGMTVYVNRIALDKYYREIFPLYERWGIKGVKFGFVAVGPQEKMKWLYDAVALAGKHRLMVDIHDAYRPSGLSRTLPNLLTQEGIRGNEHMPTSEHNVTLPYTRYACGAGDYTICYYTDRIKTTHAHQLAASVVMFSPLQFILWYDRPDSYRGEPEIEWFESLPTVWDETRVLDGAIGDSITVARRSGEEWYVAALVDENPRRVKIALDFLEPGKTYQASIYRDDESETGSRTGVKIECVPVDNATVLNGAISAHGGYTVRCVPETRKDREN